MLDAVAIIQARMQSTRLPGKVLLPLPEPGGESVLGHIIRQVTRSKYVNAVIAAIPEGEPDDVLFRSTSGLKGLKGITRGSEQNVLQRFLDASDLYPSEYIVRLTGDNPLIDASVIDEAMTFMIKNETVDYVLTTGLPLGLNVEVIKVAALKKCAQLEALNEADREHVTYGVRTRPNLFSVAYLPLHEWWNASPEVRFTLDTFEDYIFLNAVFYGLEKSGYFHDISHLNILLKEAPWMASINKNVVQKNAETSLRTGSKEY